LLSLDRFSSPLRLNFNGQDSIPSGLGVITTVVLFLIWLVYSIQKLQILFLHKNPSITVATTNDYFDRSYQVDFNKVGFKIAFGVNDFATGKPLDDPNYVRWLVSITTWVN
jgi:hypothetical protein